MRLITIDQDVHVSYNIVFCAFIFIIQYISWIGERTPSFSKVNGLDSV